MINKAKYFMFVWLFLKISLSVDAPEMFLETVVVLVRLTSGTTRWPRATCARSVAKSLTHHRHSAPTSK